MYIEIGLEEDELARPLGEKTSEISLNWCHEPVNLCTVGNFDLVLRSVCGLRGEIRRYIRLVSDRQEQALLDSVLCPFRGVVTASCSTVVVIVPSVSGQLSKGNSPFDFTYLSQY